jgi:hypothetical protein
MPKIMSGCFAVLLATVILGTWAMTRSTAESGVAGPAAMNPLEMMTNTKDLPVHEIVDAV